MCSGLSINDLSALTNGKMDHTFYSTIRGTELVLQQQQKRKRKKHHHQRHQLPAQQGTESLVE